MVYKKESSKGEGTARSSVLPEEEVLRKSPQERSTPQRLSDRRLPVEPASAL